VATGGRVAPGELVFLGVLGLKKLSSCGFDRIVLVFGYIVERTNITGVLSGRFFAISILKQNYDVIDGVISGFAKVVLERCGFHRLMARRISWREVISVFPYLL